jgi:hypothetical protein
MDWSAALSLPEDFVSKTLDQSSIQAALNPTTPTEFAINFILDEIQKDFNSDIRALSVPWTAGHLQRIFPVVPMTPSAPSVTADDDANVIIDFNPATMEYAIGSGEYTNVANPDLSGDKTVKVRIKDDGINGAGSYKTLTFKTNKVVAEAPIADKGAEVVAEIPGKEPNAQEEPKIISVRPTSIVQSDPPVARPEALVSEYSLSAEELAQSEKRIADLLAAKQARSKARVLAAERRRIQLEALGTKLAATKARGEALMQKSSWINLMKNFQGL